MHVGQAVAPHDVWTEWRPEIAVVAALAIVTVFYVSGTRRLWAHAGGERVITRNRAAAGVAGLVTLWITLASPLEVAAGGLLTLHMVQHLLLVMVAAPLLVIGRAPLALLWALPLETRRNMGIAWARSPLFRRFVFGISAPAIVWILHTLALWVWHTPSLYDLAAADDGWHALEHASFLGTAILFVMPVEKLWRSNHGMSDGIAMLYVFSSAMQSGALGALLALSRSTWYESHETSAPTWGVTPLEDQQLAGVLMWGPASAVYLVVLLMLVKLWLSRGEPARGKPTAAVTSGA